MLSKCELVCVRDIEAYLREETSSSSSERATFIARLIEFRDRNKHECQQETTS
jgi:hypothetical protein